MTFKEVIRTIIIPVAIGISLIYYQYNLENPTTTKPEITLSADSTDKNNPIIYYQVNNIANKELLYFSLFNTSLSGKKLYLVLYKLIKPNNRYSWQTEIQHNEYGTIIKRLSLDAEEEYFKAVVMDKHNNILANAELRI